MKKNISLIIMVLGIVLVSCEKENVELLQEASAPDGSALITKGGPQTGGDPFQLTLQWTSYISMQVLYNGSDPDSTVRNDFATALGASDKVAMEDLIGPSVDSQFKDQFLSLLFTYIYYEHYGGKPKGEGDPPPVPVTQGPGDPPCPPLQICVDVQAYVDYFVAEILDDNCVELYMPDALTYGDDSLEMTSTAHPLNDSGSNLGHRKGNTYFPPLDDEPGFWEIWVSIQNVDDYYVLMHDNVIVARPFRPSGPFPSSHPCAYPGYPVNLTLFLD